MSTKKQPKSVKISDKSISDWIKKINTPKPKGGK